MIQKATPQIVLVSPQQKQSCLIIDNSITPNKRICKWLYFSHLKNGFASKISTVFYDGSPCPEHTSWGAWSQKGVVFEENPGEMLHQHGKSKFHKQAIPAEANLTIEESIASKNKEEWAHVIEFCIGKLVQTFCQEIICQ